MKKVTKAVFPVAGLGTLIRHADEHDWGHVLYISRPIDDCWSDTPAAFVEVDRYSEPEPVTIVGVEYDPCLDVGTVQEIRMNALAQVANPRWIHSRAREPDIGGRSHSRS